MQQFLRLCVLAVLVGAFANPHFAFATQQISSQPAHHAQASQRPSRVKAGETVRELVQKKIRYVFVLYQENRSFDSYFGKL